MTRYDDCLHVCIAPGVDMYQCITALAQAHQAHPVLSFFVLTLVTAPGVTKGNIVTSGSFSSQGAL